VNAARRERGAAARSEAARPRGGTGLASAPHTSRRGFLRLAGASAAWAGLARLRPLAPLGLAGCAAPGERFFAPQETEILAQVVERMVESGAPGAPRVRETPTLDTIDALCRSLDPELTGPLPALLRLVEYGPLLFELRPARFTALDATRQAAHLGGWMQSRFHWRRLAFQALRNLAFLGYYSQDESWPAIGYAGPLVGRPEASA
jgi:hypothetical protein